jgi:hypothetical protein
MSQLASTQPRRRHAAPSSPVHYDELGEISAFINSLPENHDIESDDEGVDLPLLDSLHPSMPPLEPATQEDVPPPPSPPPPPPPPSPPVPVPAPAPSPIQRYVTPPLIHQPFPHWDDPISQDEEKAGKPKRQRVDSPVPDSDVFVDPNAPFTPPSQAAEEWYFRMMSQPRDDE